MGSSFALGADAAARVRGVPQMRAAALLTVLYRSRVVALWLRALGSGSGCETASDSAVFAARVRI